MYYLKVRIIRKLYTTIFDILLLNFYPYTEQ